MRRQGKEEVGVIRKPEEAERATDRHGLVEHMQLPLAGFMIFSV